MSKTIADKVYKLYQDKGLLSALEEANKHPSVSYNYWCRGCDTRMPSKNRICLICGQRVYTNKSGKSNSTKMDNQY